MKGKDDKDKRKFTTPAETNAAIDLMSRLFPTAAPYMRKSIIPAAPAPPTEGEEQEESVLDQLVPAPPVSEDCGACNDTDPEFVACPMCDGDGVELGRLGNLMHYRCRACGMDFNRRVGS